MVAQRQDHRPIAVNLLESDFPLVVAFLPVHGDHWIQCRTVCESQLFGVLDGFPQLVVPVPEQLLCNLFWMRGQEKRQAICLRIPIGRAAILLAGEPLGTYVQTRIVAAVRLVQVKNVESDGLLRLHIPFNSDVPQRPNVCPRRFMSGTLFKVPELPSVARLVQSVFRTFRWSRVQGTDQPHVLVEHHLLPR